MIDDIVPRLFVFYFVSTDMDPLLHHACTLLAQCVPVIYESFIMQGIWIAPTISTLIMLVSLIWSPLNLGGVYGKWHGAKHPNSSWNTKDEFLTISSPSTRMMTMIEWACSTKTQSRAWAPAWDLATTGHGLSKVTLSGYWLSRPDLGHHKRPQVLWFGCTSFIAIIVVYTQYCFAHIIISFHY